MFSVLNNQEMDSTESFFTPTRPCQTDSILKAPKKAFSKISWADMSENDDYIVDFPSLTSDPKQSLIDQQKLEDDKQLQKEKIEQDIIKQQEKEINSKLQNMKTIVIKRVAKHFNKETNKLEYVDQVRTLKVVSSDHFNRTSQLISRYKTHTKSGFDRKAQNDKISLTNSLLEWCYKDPRSTSFIYCCVKIHTRNGNTLVREQINKGSDSPFFLEEFIYYPPL